MPCFCSHSPSNTTQLFNFIRKLPLSVDKRLFNFDNISFLMELKSRVVLDGPCNDDYDDLWASLSTVRGTRLQMRCRLILLISDHPIQRGIRKECRTPLWKSEPSLWKSGPSPKKQLFQGVKPKKSCPNFFCGSRIHIKNTFCKKIGSKRPFQPSAVVRAIYTRLYGVATAN